MRLPYLWLLAIKAHSWFVSTLSKKYSPMPFKTHANNFIARFINNVAHVVAKDHIEMRIMLHNFINRKKILIRTKDKYYIKEDQLFTLPLFLHISFSNNVIFLPATKNHIIWSYLIYFQIKIPILLSVKWWEALESIHQLVLFTWASYP